MTKLLCIPRRWSVFFKVYSYTECNISTYSFRKLLNSCEDGRFISKINWSVQREIVIEIFVTFCFVENVNEFRIIYFNIAAEITLRFFLNRIHVCFHHICWAFI